MDNWEVERVWGVLTKNGGEIATKMWVEFKDPKKLVISSGWREIVKERENKFLYFLFVGESIVC